MNIRILKEIKRGANVIQSQITFKGVADMFGMKFVLIDKEASPNP
jgi:hypothetical protein